MLCCCFLRHLYFGHKQIINKENLKPCNDLFLFITTLIIMIIFCLFVFLCFCVSVFPPFRLSIFPSFHLSVFPSFRLSVFFETSRSPVFCDIFKFFTQPIKMMKANYYYVYDLNVKGNFFLFGSLELEIVKWSKDWQRSEIFLIWNITRKWNGSTLRSWLLFSTDQTSFL